MSADNLAKYNIESTIPTHIAENEGGEVFGFQIEDNPAPGLCDYEGGKDSVCR